MSENIKEIYNIAFDIIQIRLSKKGPIVPFTVTVEKNKTKPTVSMYEPITSNTVQQLEIIRKDLREMIESGDIEALCLCFDVRVTDPRTNAEIDAIQMELSDRKTGTVNVYVPYDFTNDVIIKTPFQVQSDLKYF